jgi:hypothetical protein
MVMACKYQILSSIVIFTDNCKDESDVAEQMKCLQIQDDYDSDTVQNVLKDAFRLQDSNLVLKASFV